MIRPILVTMEFNLNSMKIANKLFMSKNLMLIIIESRIYMTKEEYIKNMQALGWTDNDINAQLELHEKALQKKVFIFHLN